MGVYIGLIVADDTVQEKLKQKPNHAPLWAVREALQWPAKAEIAPEDHPEHGLRWVAVGKTADGRELIAQLLPEPSHEGGRADTWRLKSALWL
ncbi:MAG: hypothetical protein ACRCYU_15905 [Nocardioides sp.]